jgi:HSP20 family molecular chaperone IbpA
MSQVIVSKVKQHESDSPSFVEQVKTLGERVRERAYELFQHRQKTEGSALDDWLNAERELIWAPEADLVEKNNHFELQLAMPGFEAKEVSVIAFSDGIAVRAESVHKHEKGDGDVHFCEFGERTLFRRFDLPEPIQVDKVTAHLEKGVLHILVPRTEGAAKNVSVAAA